MRHSIFSREKIKTFATFICCCILIVFPTALIANTIEDGIIEGLKSAFLYTGLFIGFFTVILGGMAIIVWIANMSAHTTFRIKKLEKVDFLGSKELYRDILKNNSPATLSYLDQMDYNPVVAVTAVLLGLENRIPIYMTGSISPYYYKTPPNNYFSCSHACITSS